MSDQVISMSQLDAEDLTGDPAIASREQDREEGLDITPQRTMMHRAIYPPRLSLNGLLISLLCTLLLVMMGFVPVSLPTPLGLLAFGGAQDAAAPVSLIRYTFQLPLALFMAAFLGPFMGTGTVLLFLGLGLFFFPLFANGGGLDYLKEPGFGYLVGTVVAAMSLGKTFHKAFQKHGLPSRSLKIFMKALMAVMTLHAVGVVYLVALAATGQLPWPELPSLALHLTLETAPYDFIATFVFLCLVRQFRLALWLVLY